MSNNTEESSGKLAEGQNELFLSVFAALTHAVEGAITGAFDELDDQLMTLPQVAHYLQVSERTVETLIAEGELQPIYVRSCRRFEPEAVKAYVRSQANGNASTRR